MTCERSSSKAAQRPRPVSPIAWVCNVHARSGALDRQRRPLTRRLGTHTLLGADHSPPADEEYLVLCWGSEPGSQADVSAKDQAQAGPQVQVLKRTLLQLAIFHGALRCTSSLLARGANPGCKSSDGLTAYDVSGRDGSRRRRRARQPGMGAWPVTVPNARARAAPRELAWRAPHSQPARPSGASALRGRRAAATPAPTCAQLLQPPPNRPRQPAARARARRAVCGARGRRQRPHPQSHAGRRRGQLHGRRPQPQPCGRQGRRRPKRRRRGHHGRGGCRGRRARARACCLGAHRALGRRGPAAAATAARARGSRHQPALSSSLVQLLSHCRLIHLRCAGP